MSATTVTERTYIGPAFADAKVFDAMRVGVVTCRRRRRFLWSKPNYSSAGGPAQGAF